MKLVTLPSIIQNDVIGFINKKVDIFFLYLILYIYHNKNGYSSFLNEN